MLPHAQKRAFILGGGHFSQKKAQHRKMSGSIGQFLNSIIPIGNVLAM